MILKNKNLSELPLNLNSETINIDCSENKLTSLVGSPKLIYGFFKCNNNMLKNLIGGPEHVELSFNCSSNRLTSLLGAPKFVGGNFWCDKNPQLLDVSDLWPTFIKDYLLISLNEKWLFCH